MSDPITTTIDPRCKEAHERMGAAFAHMHADIKALTKAQHEAGQSFPLVALGIVGLDDGKQTSCCSFINGKHDQIVDLLADICMQTQINPLEITITMARRIHQQKQQAKEN